MMLVMLKKSLSFLKILAAASSLIIHSMKNLENIQEGFGAC